jgi:hypothetical protein
MAQHIEVTSSVTVTTNTETPIVEFQLGPQVASTPVPPSSNIAPTMISGVMCVSSTGTGTVAWTIRVRQGIGIGGAVVGIADGVTVAPSSSYNIPFRKFDPVGATAYTVTAQQTSGTGNGTAYGSFDCDQNQTGIA